MKRKQLLKNIPGLMMAGALCFCMTVQAPQAGVPGVGAQSVEAAENGEEVKAVSSSSSKADANKHTSERIAVVNLDEGIKVDGKTVVYADQIVSLPNEKDYRYTSLADAKEGVENGTYGAYILIPATFSKTVASINSSPLTCQLNYALDRNLDADIQYKLLHEIFSFNTDLNNDLSYMYLENIMNEFHTAQDNAKLVMNNDKKDKEAIDNINPNDLVSMVKLPEMKQQENNIPVLDISSYTSNITSILGEIDSSLNSGVQEVNEGLQLIMQTGSDLQKELDSIWTGVDELPKLDKIDAKQYIKTADEKFERVAKEAKDFVDGYQTQLDETSTEISELVKRINQSLNAGGGRGSDDTQIAIPYVAVEESEGQFVLCYKYKNSNQAINGAPTITLALQCKEEETERAEKLRAAYTLIMKALRTGETGSSASYSYTQNEVTQLDTVEITYVDENGESHTVTGAPTSPVYTYTEVPVELNGGAEAKSADEILAELDRDPNFDRAGYPSCAELIREVETNPSLLEAKKTLQITGGNVKDFGKYPEQVLGSAVSVSNGTLRGVNVNNLIEYDDSGKPLYDYESGNVVTIGSRIANLTGNKIATMKKNFSESVKKNAIAFEETGEELTGAVDEAVDKVNDDIKNKSEKIKENIDDSKDAVQNYHRGVNEHRPTFRSDAAGRAGDVHSNATEMMSEVMKNNNEHVKYANDVFTTANDNVNSLRQSITDNQNASNEAVQKGLEDAKSVKDSTSRQNQDLMQSFTEKLSYTRLGTLENTTTYKFIANPMVAVDESSDASKILDSVEVGSGNAISPSAEQKTQTGAGAKKRTVTVDKAAQPVKVITYVLVAALLVALAGLCGYILHLKRVRGRHRMDY